MDKQYIAINPNNDGTAQTVMANYGRMSYANAERTDTRKATFIMERDIILVNGTKDDIPGAVKATYGKTKTGAAVCDYGSKPTLIMEREKEPKILSYTRDGRGQVANRHTRMLPTSIHASNFENTRQYVVSDWRIRKLTPRECFRLMDVDDKDIDKIQAAGIPKTQQYKLAGNSIVVSCLYHLFRKMFVETGNESNQQELF